MNPQQQRSKAAPLLSILALAWITGCATPFVPNVSTYEDPFNGLRIDQIPANLLPVESASGELVWLDAARVFHNAIDFKYYFEVRYQSLPSTGHLQITPGQSLTIRADGKEMRFSGGGSENPRSRSDGTLFEFALYPVTADDLRAIAKATKVEVTVAGRNRTVQRAFEKANFDRFAEFVSLYAR